MMLTTTERQVLEMRLNEAETAYHQLLMGKSPRVFVDQNGERIEYAMANSARLSTYIEELKRKLGRTRIMGPMKAWF